MSEEHQQQEGDTADIHSSFSFHVVMLYVGDMFFLNLPDQY